MDSRAVLQLPHLRANVCSTHETVYDQLRPACTQFLGLDSNLIRQFTSGGQDEDRDLATCLGGRGVRICDYTFNGREQKSHCLSGASFGARKTECIGASEALQENRV
jgi:hypothetical protein